MSIQSVHCKPPGKMNKYNTEGKDTPIENIEQGCYCIFSNMMCLNIDRISKNLLLRNNKLSQLLGQKSDSTNKNDTTSMIYQRGSLIHINMQ